MNAPHVYIPDAKVSPLNDAESKRNHKIIHEFSTRPPVCHNSIMYIFLRSSTHIAPCTPLPEIELFFSILIH